jgi:hypothetical protein
LDLRLDSRRSGPIEMVGTINSPKSLPTFIGRASTALLVVVAALYASLVASDFAHYTATYPYLAIDDSLANVSYSLATVHRYGFLASPIQGGSRGLRSRGFYNYGPWYFWLGAVLISFFGYSLALLRAIHLIGILFISLAAFLFFESRRGKVAAAFVSIGILYCFDKLQWPMVRPDIMVSVFAILFIVFSGRGIRSGKALDWFFAGLFAGCSALTHLIAWALIPACAFVFIGTYTAEGFKGAPWLSWRNPIVQRLAAVTSGGICATLMFLASFGFRISEFISFTRAYGESHKDPSVTYTTVLFKHLDVAYSFLLSDRVLLFVVVMGILTGIALLVGSIVGRKSSELACLLPPLAVGVGYLASLGAYNNFHQGYAILSQIVLFWFLGATIYVLLGIDRLARLSFVLNLLVVAVLAYGGLSLASAKMRFTSDRRLIEQKWAPIPEYTDRVLDLLPMGARVWGSLIFGIETPVRIELVQFWDAKILASRSSEPIKQTLAPDYVVQGYPERTSLLISVFNAKSDVSRQDLNALSGLFPGYRYDVIGLVAGDPYGVTKIYERHSGSQPERRGLPFVSLYDPASRTWAHVGQNATAATINLASPARFAVGFSPNPSPVLADYTVSAAADKGDYLLRVDMALSASSPIDARGVVCVTPTPDVTSVIGELGPDFDCAPYVGSQTSAYVIHRHNGGSFFVSQLASAGAKISGVSLAALRPTTDVRSERGTFRPLPDFSQWRSAVDDVASKPNGSEEIAVAGNSTQWGYQISSPPVDVQPNTEVTVRLPVIATTGEVGVGILDQSQTNWLKPPSKPGRDIIFNSGSNRSFFVVVANNNIQSSGNERSQFIVKRGTYSAVETGFYIDLLTR